jgi:hypothetical protein
MTESDKKPVVAKARTIADLIAGIMKIAETDPQAADAALQRLARAREAREEARFSAFLRGDPEVDSGKSDAEVIEHLGELDTSAEDAPIEEIKAETTATKVVDGAEIGDDELAALDEAHKEPNNLRELMRATLAKITGEIHDDDQLAKDKKKVRNALKKVGRTLADLPADFWELPRIAKIPGERSRQSEFYRIVREVQEEMRKAEVLRELEKRGRPANYHDLPVGQQHRINVNIRQRRHRDKMRKPSSKPTVTPLPLADIAGGDLRFTLIEMSRRLNIWARAGSNPRARQLREPVRQKALIRAAAMYSRYFNQHHKAPSQVELAKWLRLSKDQARRRLNVLTSLYAPGGPWASS